MCRTAVPLYHCTAGQESNAKEVDKLVKDLNLQFDNLCQVLNWRTNCILGATRGSMTWQLPFAFAIFFVGTLWCILERLSSG